MEEKKEAAAPPKKKSNIVVPPKDFDLNNLENLWKDTGKIDKNKVENVVYAPIQIQTKKYNNQQINLKLTEKVSFSMTNFEKVNKGLANSSINCYMNVALQSLIACPAFFNMLTAISSSEDEYFNLTEKRPILRKFIEFSRYFEP